MKGKLENLLREKRFSLLAKLSSPKEEILDILPFILGKSIILVINDKFKWPLK